MTEPTTRIHDYKIGDSLYRGVVGAGVFHFIVDGVRTFKDGAQIEVECQTCSHGWKCRLLLAEDDYRRIVSVHMLNEDDDDRQRHWHGNDGLHFWATAEEAREETLRLLVKRSDERVKELEARLESARKHRDELKAAVDTPESR